MKSQTQERSLWRTPPPSQAGCESEFLEGNSTPQGTVHCPGPKGAAPRAQTPGLAEPTLLHDLHDLHHLVHVLPGRDQPLQHQHLVVVEHVSVQAAHHLGRDR